MLKLLSIQQNKIQTEDHYIINNELDDLLNKELVELFLKNIQMREHLNLQRSTII